MRCSIVAVGLFVDLAATVQPAAACTPVGNAAHLLDPTQADDHTPPSAVTVRDVVVARTSVGEGCGADCGGPNLMLQVDATDDRGGPIGFQVAIVGGRAPRDLWINPAAERVALGSGQLEYLFAEDDYGWSFDLELRAVDANGNLGPATRVTVRDPDQAAGGCSTGHRSPGTVGLALAVATLMATRRRR